MTLKSQIERKLARLQHLGISLVLGLSLAFGGLWVLGRTEPVAHAAGEQCFAEYTGDNVTDFSSVDAQAVRDAMAAASAGGTVKVAGYCAGVVTQGASTQVALITHTLTLAGGYTTTNWLTAYPITQPTTLDAQGAGRILNVNVFGGSVTVSGLTFHNGVAGGTTSGGAMNVAASNLVVITSSTFYSNTATLHGGAVNVETNRVDVFNSTFISNSASNFGGALNALNGNGNVYESRFESNVSGNIGGAMYIAFLDTLSNTQILSNTAGGNGGGAASESMGLVFNSVLQNNRASNGGGLHTANISTLSASQFISNTATLNGGGVRTLGNVGTLANTSFISNTAGDDGAGLHMGGLGTTFAIAPVFHLNALPGPVDATRRGAGLYTNGTLSLTYGLFEANQSRGEGAGVYAERLIANGTVFSGNVALRDGGGANVKFIEATDVRFEANMADDGMGSGNGGGLVVRQDGGTALTSTVFFRNSAVNDGGGAFLGEFALHTMTNTQFISNTARNGGGLVSYGTGGNAARIQNSGFYSNTAQDQSGAFYPIGGTAFITNTTFSGNRVTIGQGGAIRVPGGGSPANVWLFNTTIASNTASSGSAWIVAGTLNISQTLVMGTCAGGGGTVNDLGFNLYSEITCGTQTPGLAATVGTLGNNGGSTLTHALLPNSPAIDAGDPTFAGPPFTDQRGAGFARVQNGRVDVGAFEYSPFSISGLTAQNSSPTVLGNTTFFTASVSSGSNLTYTWNFGNGITATSALTNYIYPAVGTYTALVTATNGVNTLIATTPVTITDMPVSGLTAQNSGPTAIGNTTFFTASISMGNNVSYTWNFGNGITATGALTNYIYPMVGTYTALVTATNNVNTITAATPVTITDVAITGLNVTSNSPSLLGATSHLTATTTTGTGVSYLWNFGNGIVQSSGNSPVISYTYPVAGNYTAIVTATNTFNSQSGSTLVLIQSLFKLYLPLISK